MPVIDYYFYSGSPFTYLGHRRICEIAEEHGAELRFKPVDLSVIWGVSGAVPPAKRPPVRQRLRYVELQRIAEYRGVKINIRPKFWPVDASLADRTVIALMEAGHDPRYFMGKVFAGLWANEDNIADEPVLASYLSQAGLDPTPALADARTDEIEQIRQRNSHDAIASDAVGVPTYVLNGEPFWGQDRIEYLDQALKSGRPPYRPPIDKGTG